MLHSTCSPGDDLMHIQRRAGGGSSVRPLKSQAAFAKLLILCCLNSLPDFLAEQEKSLSGQHLAASSTSCSQTYPQILWISRRALSRLRAMEAQA